MAAPLRGPRIPAPGARRAACSLPPAVAGCALGGPPGPSRADPLIALADAARADAALAAAAIAADPTLAERLQPLVDARTAHAAALDAEVARLDPRRPHARARDPGARRPPGPAGPGAARPRRRPGAAAGEVALGLPVDRVGLVASVAACCAAYATVLA